MMAPTHVAVSLAASIALARVGTLPISAAYLLVIIAGSLAPDLDSNDGALTRPGRILRRFISRGAADLLDGIMKTVSGLINYIFGHRGFTHWGIVGVCIYVIGLVIERYWLAWFGWAYLWHIIADAFTKSGVPLLAPMVSRNISLSSMRTGSIVEAGIVMVMLVISGALGWPLLPENTRYWLVRYYHLVF